jgi:hypothetical protein
VLLLGDATYDYKDYLRAGVVNKTDTSAWVMPPMTARQSYIVSGAFPELPMIYPLLGDPALSLR